MGVHQEESKHLHEWFIQVVALAALQFEYFGATNHFLEFFKSHLQNLTL